MSMLPHSRFALALTLSMLSGGCNAELQRHAEAFLEALATDDYAKFESVAGSELVAEVPEADFLDIAETYEQLGEETDRTRTGVAWTNGVGKIDYALEHEKGDVHLVVTSRGETLDGFEITGDTWRKAALDRKQVALESLIGAAQRGDRAAARTLVHPSIADHELDALLTRLGPLGAHTKLEVSDARIPEFRLIYASTEMFAKVRLSGKSIIAFNFRPGTQS